MGVSPGYNELVTTTLFNQGPAIIDQIMNNLPFYYWMKENGKLKAKSGGYELRVPLYWDDNGTVKWYSGYEVLDTTPQDVITAAKYPWKQLSGSVTISGLEKRQNSGKEAMFDLVESRMENLKNSMMNVMEAGLFSDGTGSGGKQMDGLDAAIPTNVSSGIYGGINRASFSIWRPTARQSSAFGVVRSAATIKGEYDAVITPLSRNKDKIDLILSNDTDFNYLLSATQAIQQIASSKMAEVGFDAIKYRGAEVVNCGGLGGAITSTKNFLLNSKYFELHYHKDCNFVPLDPETRSPVNQDATVKLVAWMGNLVCSGQKFHGVLF